MFDLSTSSAKGLVARKNHFRYRRMLPQLLVLCVITGLSAYYYYSQTHTQQTWFPDGSSVWDYIASTKHDGQEDTLRLSSSVLRSQGAKASFRTNLKQDEKYILSFIQGGWNNEVIDIVNLLYLASLSKRTPILFAFTSASFHIGHQSRDVAVSEIFDLGGLSTVLDDMSIIEMHELKATETEPSRMKRVVFDGAVAQVDKSGNPLKTGDIIVAEDPEEDKLGCFSFWLTNQKSPISQDQPGYIRTEWTPLPLEVFADNGGNKWATNILDVANLLHADHANLNPESSARFLEENSLAHPSLPPEDQVACLDHTYYLWEQVERWDMHGEYRFGAGAWNRVGKHLRWRFGILAIRDSYLRKLFDIRTHAPIPKYMAIHIRRHDFSDNWLALSPRHFAHATWEVLKSIKERMGYTVTHIVCATDETDPDWLDQLRTLGWYVIDHNSSHTATTYGYWFPTIIDSAVLSGGAGMLGVASSTMSILAYRRTIDWNGGVSRLIEDSHHVPSEWEWSWPRVRI